RHDHYRHAKREPGPVDEAGEEGATQLVRAQPELSAWCLERRTDIDLVGRMARQQLRHQRHRDEDDHQRRAHPHEYAIRASTPSRWRAYRNRRLSLDGLDLGRHQGALTALAPWGRALGTEGR